MCDDAQLDQANMQDSREPGSVHLNKCQLQCGADGFKSEVSPNGEQDGAKFYEGACWSCNNLDEEKSGAKNILIKEHVRDTPVLMKEQFRATTK